MLTLSSVLRIEPYPIGDYPIFVLTSRTNHSLAAADMPPAPGIGKLPVPAGWTPEQWHRTWNRAHSRFYHKVRHQPPAERKAAVDAAHYSGEIRALALTINPRES